ncbi:pentapeptide repeat-containing protein [Paracoccus aerius]
MRDADLTGADLDYSRMAGIDFSGSNLTAVSMEAVWANKARLVGTTLVAANLSEAKFYNADLANATLGDNTNRFTIWEGVHMENCTGCPVDW